MGALHDGHISLVNRAKKECDFVAATIFVNPIQFGPKEDFKKYPRTLIADKKLLKKSGVDLLFCPSCEHMYPQELSVFVDEIALSDHLCGLSRKGHFRGVCTVVTKLFNIVTPEVAYFGQKDYQQALIIKRLTRDLNFPVVIRICPTLRESDGLAMSSRNRYLSAVERLDAAVLYKALCTGKNMIEHGARDKDIILKAMIKVIGSIKSVSIDYLSLLNADDLSECKIINSSVVLAGAIFIGGTRLIDNILVKVKNEKN